MQKQLAQVVILSCILLLLSCQGDKQQPKGFVKLEKPLRQTLPEIRFSVINLKGDSSDEVIFSGSGVSIKGDYIHIRPKEYTLYASQAVETNRYIFVPIALHGGSGQFWDLNVVDKKTLRSVDEVSLGDRVWIIEVFKLDSHPDAVGISYIPRSVVESEVMYDLSKMITQHFQMLEGTLEEIRDL